MNILLIIIAVYYLWSVIFGFYLVSLESQTKDIDFFIISKRWKTVFLVMPLCMWLVVILLIVFYIFVICWRFDNKNETN
jgi:hypothetical protein